ncbi:hypothetical protein ALO85_101492 [Pseudomonas syringae pv. aptata]|nr:hypothetical protein ALO85_101492 [Pseudomonas syringae pv. aptata]
MPIRTIRARICSTVAREREGRSGSFMEDLTQDVRHVLRSRRCKHQKTIISFEGVSRTTTMFYCAGAQQEHK